MRGFLTCAISCTFLWGCTEQGDPTSFDSPDNAEYSCVVSEGNVPVFLALQEGKVVCAVRYEVAGNTCMLVVGHGTKWISAGVVECPLPKLGI